ncbi:MAG TPA: hypothetical protein VF736_03685 [Pyrinomonadaceae bacterium]
MSSKSKPSYLSNVLRAGARPFAAAQPARPRRPPAPFAPPPEPGAPGPSQAEGPLHAREQAGAPAAPRPVETADDGRRPSHAPSLPDEPRPRAAQEEPARRGAPKGSDLRGDEAQRRAATPAPEGAAALLTDPAQTARPSRQSGGAHKTLEAHIEELRARMQTPREPRASDGDSAAAPAPSASAPHAPRAAQAQAPRSVAAPRPRAGGDETDATPAAGARREPEPRPAQARPGQVSEPRTRAHESRREPPAKEEHAPRLSINRLDVRIVERPHPPAPPPEAPPRHAPRAGAADALDALDRHYLGRFYLG